MNDDRLKSTYADALARRRGRSGAACPEPGALLALARREGPEDARLRTLDHVMACADGCREELALLRSIDEAGSTAEADAAPPGVVPITRARGAGRGPRWLLPALAAAVVMFGLGLERQRRGGEPAQVRGGEGGGVELVSPGDGASATSPTLRWRRVAGARGYTAEVLDASGNVVANRRLTDTSFAFTGAPGTYRWWVRADLPSGEAHSPMRLLVVGP